MKRIVCIVIIYMFIISSFTGVYAENIVTSGMTGSGLGNIFGLSEEYGKLSGTTRERFEQVRAELPSEMPVYLPISASGTDEIYVFPGSINGDGSINSPYGTLKEAVDSLNGEYSGKVIRLYGGEYTLEDTTTLANVSANSDAPLFISKYGEDEVIFRCGINIDVSGMTAVPEGNIKDRMSSDAVEYIKCVNLDDLGITDYGLPTTTTLTVNSDNYTLARWPDNTTTGMKKYEGADGENGVVDSGPISEGVGSLCGEPRETGRTGEQGFEIAVEDDRVFSWKNTGDIYMKGSFYAEWNTATVQVHSFNADKSSVRTETGISYGARYDEGNSFYYMNVLEELDKPGEWYLDRENGMLYVYPMETVKSMTLQTNTNAVLLVTNSNNIVFDSISFKNTSGRAIVIRNCENILVQNCLFDDTNLGGVLINGESKYCGVINSVFSNMSGIPVNVYCPVSEAPEIQRNLKAQNLFIQNNYFYNCGQISVRGVGVIISHNVISNSPGNAIYLSTSRECVVEYNEISNAVTEVHDAGAIYMGGFLTGGNHIRYNYIHDCGEERSVPYGIYFDDFCSRSFMYGNILEGCMAFLHNGSDNTVYNNVILNSNRSIQDSTNYLVGNRDYTDRWEYGVLQYGTFTNFLDESNASEYIDVLSKVYMDRYPTMYEWSINLYKRIEEYQINGNVTESDYTAVLVKADGTTEELDLDDWLRYPRYNYYANNALINCANNILITDEGQVSMEMGNNAVLTSNENPFTNGYIDGAFSELKNVLEGFETIPVDEIGIKQTLGNLVQLKKARASYPCNGQEINIQEAVISWKCEPGATKNILQISSSEDFSNLLVDVETVSYVYELTRADKSSFSEGQTYYWRIISVSDTRGVEGDRVISDTFSFKAVNTPGNCAILYSEDFENYTDNADLFANKTLIDGKTQHYTIKGDVTGGTGKMSVFVGADNANSLAVLKVVNATEIDRTDTSRGKVLKYDNTLYENDTNNEFFMVKLEPDVNKANNTIRGATTVLEYDMYFPQKIDAEIVLPGLLYSDADIKNFHGISTQVTYYGTIGSWGIATNSGALAVRGGAEYYNSFLDGKYEAYTQSTSNQTPKKSAWHRIKIVMDTAGTATANKPDTYRMYVDGNLVYGHTYHDDDRKYETDYTYYDFRPKRYSMKGVPSNKEEALVAAPTEIQNFAFSDTFAGIAFGGVDKSSYSGKPIYFDNISVKTIGVDFAITHLNKVELNPEIDTLKYNFTTQVDESTLSNVIIRDSNGEMVKDVIMAKTLSDDAHELTLTLNSDVLPEKGEYKVVFLPQFTDIYGRGLVTDYSYIRHTINGPFPDEDVATSPEKEFTFRVQKGIYAESITSVIENDGTVTVGFSLKNTSASSLPVWCTVAVYKADGSLVCAEMIEELVPAETTIGGKRIDLKVEKMTDINDVRLYVWSDEMTPYREAINIYTDLNPINSIKD